MKWQNFLYYGLRFGFGILLIFSSWHKIRSPFEFAEAIENYRILGEGLSRWVAVWVPYLEILTGFLLILGIWIDAAVLINALFMLVFLILVGQAYFRNLDIQCGCYAFDEDSRIRLTKLLENLFLLCSGMGLIRLTFHKEIKVTR
ncbi:DoxX family membrane protein [bacterium]|nr:DoxX family membrane protein [bacterium]RQV93744.1 MAG: DoxX family membrane protein [bacterium]